MNKDSLWLTAITYARVKESQSHEILHSNQNAITPLSLDESSIGKYKKQKKVPTQTATSETMPNLSYIHSPLRSSTQHQDFSHDNSQALSIAAAPGRCLSTSSPASTYRLFFRVYRAHTIGSIALNAPHTITEIQRRCNGSWNTAVSARQYLSLFPAR